MDWERIKTYFLENKLQMILSLMGLFLLVMGMGVVLLGQKDSRSSVEVISTDSPSDKVSEGQVVVVDVEGAVERPGVYELSVGARVDDALTAAGGFSEDADRIWVRRFVNLAQEIPDGTKIYIPVEGEAHNNDTSKANNYQLPISNDQGGVVVGTATIGLGSEAVGKVDINTASASELDALWGIGKKRAEAIISNRPYSSIEELKSRARIPSNVFDRIKEEVAVY